MSKVVISTDTDTKEITVNIDGQTLSVDCAYVSKNKYRNYNGDEIISYSVCFTEFGKTGDMNTTLTFCHDSQMFAEEEMQEMEASVKLTGFKAFQTKLIPSLSFVRALPSVSIKEFFKGIMK